MMNSKERAERILAWQLLHNKNWPATSMAMSVALLLSACGGSSDSGSSDSGSSDYSGSSDGASSDDHESSSRDSSGGGSEFQIMDYLDGANPIKYDESGFFSIFRPLLN